MISRLKVAAIAGMVAGPLVLVVGVIGSVAQPDGYDFVKHPTSDLGADTANMAAFSNLIGSVLPGLLLLVFTYGLWKAVASSRSGRIGTLLIGVVATGIVVTGIATEECRVMDPGCRNDSAEIVVHVIAALLAGLALLISPFVLARSMRWIPAWQDLRRTTLVLGAITVVGTVVGSAIGEGLGAYAAFVPWFAWILLLSGRMATLAGRDPTAPSVLPTTGP
jgi:Protein of unknown function (DUF998)